MPVVGEGGQRGRRMSKVSSDKTVAHSNHPGGVLYNPPERLVRGIRSRQESKEIMKYVLTFDCETTGLVDFKLPIGVPAQPHLVTLAAVLTDEEGEEVQSLYLVCKPDTYLSSPEAIKVHGITREFAERVGVPRIVVLSAFNWLAKAADEHVAYNYDYDRFVLEGEFLRADKPSPLSPSKAFCEMKAMTDVCKIPSPYKPGQFKWPSLKEAHQHAFGQDFVNAHDALADVRATVRVHRWREALQKTPVKAEEIK